MTTVKLTSADYPDVTIRFKARLPKGEGAKCKLVKRRIPARTEYNLVCES